MTSLFYFKGVIFIYSTLKKFCSVIMICIMVALIVFIGTVHLEAAPLFDVSTPYYTDVSEDMDIFEAVQWGTDNKITNGTGNNKFSPDQEITVYQIATMLCRSENIQTELPADKAYQEGWLTVEGVVYSSSKCTKASALRILFAYKDIPYYDSIFYTDENLSENENYINLGNMLGIISDTKNNLITRGEFMNMLYKACTYDYSSKIPNPDVFPITHNGDASLNQYYREIVKIPEAIRTKFLDNGWELKIDYEYLGKLTEKYNTSAIGATSNSERKIYVSSSNAIVHEFGHYLDYSLGHVSENEMFTEERPLAQKFLKSYANTNNTEYFAEYFVAFLKAQDSESLRETMKEVTPNTYSYFENLANNNWNL